MVSLCMHCFYFPIDIAKCLMPNVETQILSWAQFIARQHPDQRLDWPQTMVSHFKYHVVIRKLVSCKQWIDIYYTHGN